MFNAEEMLLASRTKGVKRMMDDNALLRVQTITPKKLYQAQREDRAIGEEIEYTRKRQTTNTTRQAEGTARPSIIQETTHWRRWNPPSHQLNIYPDALKTVWLISINPYIRCGQRIFFSSLNRAKFL